MCFYHMLQDLLKTFCIFLTIKCAQAVLLYPQFTVMQLIGSVSVPVADSPSNRKVFFDWGLQMNYDMPYNISSFYMAPIWATHETKNFLQTPRSVHEHDFTAKELYEGLENMLERYGYHRSCLRQSICELAQHPFDEAYSNVAAEVISFFLRPSVNGGFSSHEKCEETLYTLAEDQGFAGQNCHQLYPQCTDNILNLLTTMDFM